MAECVCNVLRSSPQDGYEAVMSWLIISSRQPHEVTISEEVVSVVVSSRGPLFESACCWNPSGLSRLRLVESFFFPCGSR